MRIFFLIFVFLIIRHVESGWQILPKTNLYADSLNSDTMSLASDGNIWLLVYYNSGGVFGSVYNETTAKWTSHTIDNDSDCDDTDCQVDVDFDRSVNMFRVIYQIEDEAFTRTAAAPKTSTFTWSSRAAVPPIQKKDQDGGNPRITNIGNDQWIATRLVRSNLLVAKILGKSILVMADEPVGLKGYRGNVDSTPGPSKYILMISSDLSGKPFLYWVDSLDTCCKKGFKETTTGSNTLNYNPNIAYDGSTNKFFIVRRRDASDKIFVSAVSSGSTNFTWDNSDYSFGSTKCNYPDISISNGLMVVVWHEGVDKRKIGSITINTATKKIFDTTSLTTIPTFGACSNAFPIITSNYNRKFMSCWIDCGRNIVCGIRKPTPSFSVSISSLPFISSGTLSATIQTSSITLTFDNSNGEDNLVINKITFNTTYIILQDPLPFTVPMGQQSNFKFVWKGGPAYSVTSATFETNAPTNNIVNFAITAIPNVTVSFSNKEAPSTVDILLSSQGGTVPFIISNSGLGTAAISVSIGNNPSTLNLMTPATLPVLSSSSSNATFNFSGTANSTYNLMFQCSPNCVVPSRTILLKVTVSTDCVWTQWSPYYPSDCDIDCTVSKVSKRIAIPPTGNGAPCQGNDTQIASCDKFGCPVDCVASLWTDWSPCSTTCNEGISTRIIQITKREENGGTPCPDHIEETMPCNVEPCPTNCTWGDWSLFSECDVGCGNGTSTQTREIIINATNGGLDCVGQSTNSVSCDMGDCKGCVWNPWSPYSECSASCGGGTTSRIRTFISVDSPCDIALSTQTDTCNTEACPPDCFLDPATKLIRCYNNTISTNGSVTLEGEFITGNLVVTKQSTVTLENNLPVTGNITLDDSSVIYFSSNYTVEVAKCANFGGKLILNATGAKSGETVSLFTYQCTTGQFESYELLGVENTSCTSQIAKINYSQTSVTVTFSTVNSCQDPSDNSKTFIITGGVIGGVLLLTVIIIIISKSDVISRIIYPFRHPDENDPDYV